MRKIVLAVLLLFLFVTINAQEKKTRFSLQEAIDYALKNSYNTRIAINDIESAKKKVWETTTIGLPQIDGKIDYQNFIKQQITLVDFDNDGNEDQFVFGTQQNMNGAITLRQLIFDGSYLVGLQASKTFLKISEQANEKTELLTREAIVNAYGNVLVSEKTIEILTENLKILKKSLEDATKIYENGFNEEEDVQQLQITFGNLQNQLNNVLRMKVIAYRMLNLSLGNNIEDELILTDSLESLAQTNMDLNLIAADFDVKNHVDFKIAENDRETKRLLVKLEQSKALPTLNAFLNYGAQANSNEFTFLNGNQRWFDYSLLGVSLNVPIFSSFGRNARTAQARIDLENSDIRLEETRQKLNLQVQATKNEYQFSIENYYISEKNLKLAERIEKKQRIKFFEGISTSFDLLQAQNQLYTQQQEYIQSMLNVIAQKAALENALNKPIN
jgi:outer membrane protein